MIFPTQKQFENYAAHKAQAILEDSSFTHEYNPWDFRELLAERLAESWPEQWEPIKYPMQEPYTSYLTGMYEQYTGRFQGSESNEEQDLDEGEDPIVRFKDMSSHERIKRVITPDWTTVELFGDGEHVMNPITGEVLSFNDYGFKNVEELLEEVNHQINQKAKHISSRHHKSEKLDQNFYVYTPIQLHRRAEYTREDLDNLRAEQDAEDGARTRELPPDHDDHPKGLIEAEKKGIWDDLDFIEGDQEKAEEDFDKFHNDLDGLENADYNTDREIAFMVERGIGYSQARVKRAAAKLHWEELDYQSDLWRKARHLGSDLLVIRQPSVDYEYIKKHLLEANLDPLVPFVEIDGTVVISAKHRVEFEQEIE